jgi:hypothetical protein
MIVNNTSDLEEGKKYKLVQLGHGDSFRNSGIEGEIIEWIGTGSLFKTSRGTVCFLWGLEVEDVSKEHYEIF